MVRLFGVPGNGLLAVRLLFEVFRPLQSSLPNPGAAGAFGLGTVPSRELEQLVAARRGVLSVER
jgi:hypothetical protein